MRAIIVLPILLFVTTVVSAVVNPIKRDIAHGLPCNNSTSTVTVVSFRDQTHTETTTETQVSTITVQPSLVTVALEGPGDISKSLDNVRSFESQQIEEHSQNAPINPLTSNSPSRPPSPKTFTHTIEVPAVEATKTLGADGKPLSTDIYYIGESNHTTKVLSNYVPNKTLTLGTTTLTISPIDGATVSTKPYPARVTVTGTRTKVRTETNTVDHVDYSLSGTGGRFTGMGPAGWNSSVLYNPAAASGGSLCSSENRGVSTMTPHTVIVRISSTISTITWSPYTPTSVVLPTGAYESTANIEFPSVSDYGLGKRAVEDHRRRAVCEWVTATMRGREVSWQNNWDGQKTVKCATYSTEPLPAPTPEVTKRAEVDNRRRAVCEWITATMRGTEVSWPNNWDGSKTVDCATIQTPIATPQMTTTSGTDLTTAIVSTSSSTSSDTANVPVASTTTSPLSSTSSCGPTGDFTLDFDSLPKFMPQDNTSAPFPPIFNPYQHLYFSSDWSVVPPPAAPVQPQNGTNMAIYVPNSQGSKSNGATNSGPSLFQPGAFGAGPRRPDNAFWFDAKDLYVFCDNGSNDPAVICDIVVTGYHWDGEKAQELVKTTQNFIQPPCPGYQNCATSQISLSTEFSGLSSLGFSAVVQGQQKMLWIDTVNLHWWNNTCEAGQQRLGSH